MNPPKTAAFMALTLSLSAGMLGGHVDALTITKPPIIVSAPTPDLALPLSSLGSNLAWAPGPDDFHLVVPRTPSGPVKLEIFSPDVNRADYVLGTKAKGDRAAPREQAAYFGDELYLDKKLETTFTLRDEGGAKVASKTFGFSASNRTVPLIDTPLRAGRYPLSVVSTGDGKNAFTLRASGARVEASQFTVSFRGKYEQDQLVAFFDLSQTQLGGTLRLLNYDGDGLSELELFAVSPQGKRRSLTVSQANAWAEDRIEVTKQNLGRWKLVARVKKTTKQFSNAFTFRLRLNEAPVQAVIPLPEPAPVVAPPPPPPAVVVTPPPPPPPVVVAPPPPPPTPEPAPPPPEPAPVPEPVPPIEEPPAPEPIPEPQPPAVLPSPDTERESEVVVYGRLEAAPKSNLVVIVDQLPEGASLVPGSSRLLQGPALDAQSRPLTAWIPTGTEAELPDPVEQDGRLFWVVPAGNPMSAGGGSTFGVAYTLAHSGTISLPDRPGLVLGLPGARPIGPARVAGLPETPPSSPPADPASELETALGVGDLRQLAGDGDLVAALTAAQPLSPGLPNEGDSGVFGPAASIKLTPLHVTSDPADVPTLLVEVFDAQGRPASDGLATLAILPEPATPDAAPLETGYQVKLVNGQGRVRLTTPGIDARRDQTLGTVRAEARLNNENGVVSSSKNFKLSDFSVRDLAAQETPVQASTRPAFGVGTVGVQLDFSPSSDPAFGVSGSAQGYFRFPVFGDGLLTVAANQQVQYSGGAFSVGGSLLPPARPFERFPLTGDASLPGSDVSSGDGFYLRLERGENSLTYGRVNPDFRGVLSRYTPFLQGLQARGVAGNLSGTAFAALVPVADQSYSVQGDGTALYLIPNAPVAPNSEQVRVTVFDRDAASIKRSEKLLERGLDYTIDLRSGAVLLIRPLLAADANGNPQFLGVAYASEVGSGANEFKAGVQAAYASGPIKLTGTALRFSASAGPAFGLAAEYQAQYQAGNLGLGVEGTYSGSFGVAVQGSYSSDRAQVQASVQQRSQGFVDPNALAPATAPSSAGRSGKLEFHVKVTDTIGVFGTYAVDQNFSTVTGNQAASVEARKDFGVVVAGLGVGGTSSYTGAVATNKLYALGTLEVPLAPFTVSLRQRLGLTASTPSDTLLRAEYALTPNLSLSASELLSYGGGMSGLRSQTFFGVSGRFANAQLLRRDLGGGPLTPGGFGTTNISAGYNFDNLGAEAGRFRVGIDTDVPITSTLSAQVAAEVDTTARTSLATGLSYASGGTRASGRAEFSVSGAGLKQVYTASAALQLTPDVVVSPSGEFDILEDKTTGSRFSVAGAWRGERWNLLSNNTLRGGFYGNLLEGELRASYTASERLFLRPGVAYKLAGGTFTGQAGLGATYYFTDIFGVGGNAAYLFQTGTTSSPSTGKLSLGAELSARVAPGLVVAGGIDFLGFTGLGSGFKTDPGFYVRLDYLFDETLFNRTK